MFRPIPPPSMWTSLMYGPLFTLQLWFYIREGGGENKKRMRRVYGLVTGYCKRIFVGEIDGDYSIY